MYVKEYRETKYLKMELESVKKFTTKIKSAYLLEAWKLLQEETTSGK